MPAAARRDVDTGAALRDAPDRPQPEPIATATDGADAPASGTVTITTLSNRADLISGGNALVEVSWSGSRAASPTVRVGGREVTAAFRVLEPGRAVGLVDGLQLGENVVEARVGERGARLTITNHPIGGPVFAGPQVQPWVCTTEENGLGPPVDEQCNASTKVTYLYQPEDGEPGAYEPYDVDDPPDDVATTTTDTGLTVPYILRKEEGTVDRAGYHLMVLAGPSQPWTPVEPQPVWNHKLWVPFSGGCGTMHRQWDPDPWFGLMEGSPSEGQISQHEMLSRGWMTGATGMNTLNYNCNEVVSAEALLMMKEIVIENYGVIDRTISVGNSGGAVQQHNIAASYPGILDAIVPFQSFADLHALTWDATECFLTFRYFTTISPHLWTDLQDQLAVQGKSGPIACGQFVGMFPDIFDPQNRGAFHIGAAVRFGCELPPHEQYHPIANPTGARCSLQDYQRSIWGHGGPLDAAPLLYDNTGVQYGLVPLEQGVITPEQFVDLNQKIGGLDNEGEYIAARSSMDEQTAITMYRAGRTTDARQLANVPIVDIRTVPGNDDAMSDMHSPYHTYVTQARLQRDNGTAANQVLWRMVPRDMDFEATFILDRWLDAVEADPSAASRAEKILRNRPADLLDTCWIDGEPVTDVATCEAAYPVAGDARTAAGAPITVDVRKCRLAPLDRESYAVTFTDAQWARLEATFPDGVCDWTQPSVGQQPSIPWMTFAEGPGGQPLGPQPTSVPLFTPAM